MAGRAGYQYSSFLTSLAGRAGYQLAEAGGGDAAAAVLGVVGGLEGGSLVETLGAAAHVFVAAGVTGQGFKKEFSKAHGAASSLFQSGVNFSDVTRKLEARVQGLVFLGGGFLILQVGPVGFGGVVGVAVVIVEEVGI